MEGIVGGDDDGVEEPLVADAGEGDREEDGGGAATSCAKGKCQAVPKG